MILERLAAAARQRVQRQQEIIPLSQLQAAARKLGAATGFPFEAALRGSELNFICEIKRASPSQGVLAAEFPYLEIAREYQQAGAAAISVLTEPDYFRGRDEYLAEIRREVTVPLLRKDFTIDPYQLYQARLLGADAVLLICALLDTAALRHFLTVCDELGLSALVEAHDEREIESALAAGARVIGVNNRNLRDFSVDLNTSLRLRRLVPEPLLFVAESGIRTAADINQLRQSKVNGVLIGEALMRSPDKRKMLAELRSPGSPV